MRWRPIKTAPKNKDIWVCGAANLWGMDSSAFTWQGQAGFREGRWITTSFDSNGNFLEVRPTHWMTLPKIPRNVGRF